MGQVIPSYQNRQIGALAVTGVTSQSCPSPSPSPSPLATRPPPSPFSFAFAFISVLLILVSFLQNQSPRRSLAGPSQVGPLFSLRIIHILRKVDPRLVKKESRLVAPLILQGIMDILKQALWQRENHTFEGGSQIFSRTKCTFSSGPFLSFGHHPLFHQESGHPGVPLKVVGGTPEFVG